MLTTATGSVNLSPSLSRISGAKKSFQDARNANSPTVMSAGRTPWMRIRVSAANVPQPSTSAASSSSRGSDSNALRIMNTENGSWNMISTRLRPISEFCSPMLAEHDVQRDQDRRVGHHQDRERGQEQQVLAGEVEARERVAAERGDGERADDGEQRDDRRVEQVGRDALAVARHRGVVREAEAGRLGAAGLPLDRRPAAPHEREQEQDRERQPRDRRIRAACASLTLPAAARAAAAR